MTLPGQAPIALIEVPARQVRTWLAPLEPRLEPISNLSYSRLSQGQPPRFDAQIVALSRLAAGNVLCRGLPPPLLRLRDLESTPGVWGLQVGDDILIYYSDGWRRSGDWKGGQLCWALPAAPRDVQAERALAWSDALFAACQAWLGLAPDTLMARDVLLQIPSPSVDLGPLVQDKRRAAPVLRAKH